MPGLVVEFDLFTGKISLRAWVLAADLIKLGFKLALMLSSRWSGKLHRLSFYPTFSLGPTLGFM
jgi:hypothetical protein